MKKKNSTVFFICLLIILMSACGSDTGNTVLSPTAAAGMTSTPTVQPTATATPTPEPTATSTPTPEQTATSIPTPEPEKVEEYAFEKGIFAENHYENEWLNMRITLPEGTTMTKLDAEFEEKIFIQVDWETKNPKMQLLVFAAEGASAEYYLAYTVDAVNKSAASVLGEDVTVSYEDNFTTINIGGHEYFKLGMEFNTSEKEAVWDYYCREQDGYLVCLTVMYTKNSEVTADEMLKKISAY